MHQLLNHILNIPVAFAQQTTDKTGSAATDAAGNQIQDLATTVIHSIPYWVTGFIVIIVSVILSRVVKSAVENKMTEAGMEEEHHEIQLVASRASSAAVILIGITAGLKIAGLDLTSIIAAAAFGVGFAMQDIIMNFVSGIIVLLQKRFTIGDWIKVNGAYGVIKEIQSRYTVIKNFDGTLVIVPNAELFKNQVTVVTGSPERRFNIDISVDLYMDLKEVIDQLYKSIDKCDKILKHPKPSIIVQAPGNYYNSIRIRAWVIARKGILRPISALVRQIHKDFYRKGWSFPYPTDKLVFDAEVPPDVNERAKNYIDKHKKALKKKPAIIQQQQQILQQQEQQQAQAAQPGQAQPVQAPLPQAQQIGVGGPQMETPVWLQQAAGQGAQPGSPALNQQPQQTQQPVQQGAQQPPPQVVIEKIEVGPEVKVFGPQQQPQSAPTAQNEPVPMPMPIVTALDVQSNQTPTPAVEPPIVSAPPVQSQNGGMPNPQN